MNFNHFDGYLMSRDVVLAEIKDGNISRVINRSLLPIYIERTNNIETWLEKRAIDNHRTNSRLLKKVLRLAERDDVATTLSVNGVTITDNYWVKPEGANLTWSDVRFKENFFSSLALKGDLSVFTEMPSRTPELTNIGSYEKCWIQEDGKWWLYKRANKLELFSELFIYHLGTELGFSMAKYEAYNGDIRSLDFTDGGSVNFEPAFSWMGDNDDYLPNYKSLEKYGEELLDSYVEMILLDSYCLNADRHTFNYGVLRDVTNGKVLCLAPNFDNNIALIYNGYSKTMRKSSPDLLGRMLNELEEETGAIAEYAKRHPLPVVTIDMIDRCIDATGIDVDREYVRNFVMAGYEQTPIYKMACKHLDHKIEAASNKVVDNGIVSADVKNVELEH